MQEVKRKRDESFESLLRRFNKKLQQSHKLLEAKQNKFYEKDISKNQRRASALVRNKIRTKKEYLRKIGKLPEEFDEKGRRIKIKI